MGNGLQVRSMRRFGPVAIVVLAAGTGALASLLLARAWGMSGDELVHLGQLLLPATAAALVAVGLATPLLRGATIGTRFIAVAIVSVVVALANLGVLSALMLVKHDALVVASLIAYSAATGLGIAIALSRAFRQSVRRIVESTSKLSRGDLSARIGRVEGGPELVRLAETIDSMTVKLEQTIAAERKATAVRDDLITAVSHDLRTPLAGLRAMVESIDDKVVEDPETLRRYAKEMRHSLDALVTLVDDLFELVQLDAGAIRAESERATLEEAVSLALAACGAQAVEKGVKLQTAIDGAEGVLVSPRLIRALQNLVQNAIRHTPADGTVRIYGQRDRDSIELAVEDDGEGIAEAVLERVFDPFWRGDASRSLGGAGLGLTIAKRVVEALGGDLRVRSTLGEGSRFVLVLPASASE